MICPACGHALSSQAAGAVTVDVCRGGCGGIWFDNFELQRVEAAGEFAGEALLHVEGGPTDSTAPARRRDCPRCDGIVLRRHFFSGQRQVEVDSCPSCGGIWLDAGELGLIRRENSDQPDQQAAARAYFRKLFEQDFVRTRRRGT